MAFAKLSLPTKLKIRLKSKSMLSLSLSLSLYLHNLSFFPLIFTELQVALQEPLNIPSE